ncbi:hypothetical protein [Arthrobacter sp. CDRTa11]|uniref:hypothetical protein n=1 Tax=Arthrobacter sp. CDRTa11 TaxID=2651199 RepID=UPI002265BD45|nr:hypothetical protein [Arthrobacter sp. CDRTa11]
MDHTDFAIFLNGSYGAGKTSTLDHVGDLLAEAGRPFSLMDVDWFHRSWPSSVRDPANLMTEAANMAAVWRNYKSAGPRQLVVGGVLASRQDWARYEDAFGLRIRSVRLVADDSDMEARLRRRYTPEQDSSLKWHLERYRELNSALSDADLDEAVIETSDRSPRQVATTVLAHFLPGH